MPFKQKIESDPINLFDIVHTIARNIRVIIILPIFLIFVTAIYVQFFVQHSYTSTSKIITSSGKPASAYAGLAAEFGVNIGNGSSSQNKLYPEMIKSKVIAKKMLSLKFYSNLEMKEQFLWEIIGPKNRYIFGMDIKKDEILIQKFISMISIKENFRTEILTISLSASDPVLAMNILSALIKEIDRNKKNNIRLKTIDTKNFIVERIKTTEDELIASEDSLKNFRIRNRQIQNSPYLQLKQERISREVMVLTSVFTNLKQQLENIKIEEMKESNYVLTIDEPTLPLYRSRPAKAKSVTIAGIIGLFLAVIISFIIEYFKNLSKDEQKYFKKILELLRII
ncbi:Wzz/FepE/Etk N-terminal domain-containing protein [Candidatus Marinimicrobia bacterium]|nr:Wzz/FepE/Etk N-terminal domain-containing protein [Candidatus Neomarinimicrobiota bacterium]